MPENDREILVSLHYLTLLLNEHAEQVRELNGRLAEIRTRVAQLYELVELLLPAERIEGAYRNGVIPDAAVLHR